MLSRLLQALTHFHVVHTDIFALMNKVNVAVAPSHSLNCNINLVRYPILGNFPIDKVGDQLSFIIVAGY